MKNKVIIKYVIIASVIALVLVLDLVSKHFFCYEESKQIIPNLIDFQTNYGNDGAAFGILGGKKWLLITITVVFLTAFLLMDIFIKPKSMLYNISIGFIIGGALGNLIDRIWLGHVRDFINFSFWQTFPTFNVADSFLCVGVALMCVYLVFFTGKKKEG